ncbi:MAG TPA: bifunctional alpha,alpha-trehalose-phosphate synthase (UDP-forming)/trehalose-phosphatase [Polyangiales bacterium]|nr:bifunctional alpha,alpha-trehalose-phosphate synthase (UDP-forming)/trehalose-phosphatase [Polyangiales bacterium]
MILASNRLPVTITTTPDGAGLKASNGGLASALREYHERGDGSWIGWLGDTSNLDERTTHALFEQAKQKRLKPVELSAEEVALFYDGYSNAVLWPLFHYLLDKVQLEASEEWRAYVAVNERFADAIAAEVKGSEVVWVHDYQLTLVPSMLRRRAGSARIGFFLHIPWPSADVFRILPSRAEILAGLLGADLIGFQSENDRQNFAHAAAEVLGLDFNAESLHWEDREVRLNVYPIGIDVNTFTHNSREIERMTAQIRAETRGKKILLGVDRLDYTKGLERRMLAVDRLLEREPALREQLHFIQLAVPSREKIDAYAELRSRVNELVSRINSNYGSATSSPVQFLYRSIPVDELIALYRAADVMLVTPLRDGMNLVCKEYAAARTDGLGCLILSEFAGAASQLATAITVNPYDIVGVANAIQHAMFMSEEEQQLRMRELRKVVEDAPVQAWAADFLRDLEAVEPANPALATAASELEAAVQQLLAAKNRVLLLDYDGTLAPIAELPSLAAPNQQLLTLLRRLVDAPGTAVHIVTGRSQDSIEPWLGGLPLWLHVEHGLRSRKPDGTWLPSLRERPQVIETASRIMLKYVQRLRGSFVESKAASVAFHYRRANPLAALEVVGTLRQELERACPEVQLLDGHKVLELRQSGVSKNVAVNIALEHAPADSVILAAGDDRTDEDMFAALPEGALSIRVGTGTSAARLRVESSRALLGLLSRLL